MFVKLVLRKIVVFLIVLSGIYVIFSRFQPIFASQSYLEQDNISVMFTAFTLIFSIISGFVIQTKWQTWNQLTDAIHGEISSLKQIYVLSNHFPKEIRIDLRKRLTNYLKVLIDEKNTNKTALYIRSDTIEKAIYELEETVLDINYSEHPNIGELSFDLVRNVLEYREKRLQSKSHKLPKGVKVFVVSSIFAIILTSLLLTFTNPIIAYVLFLVMGILSYGIYLLIDDLDNPYRKGLWYISLHDYAVLYDEIHGSINSKSESHPEL